VKVQTSLLSVVVYGLPILVFGVVVYICWTISQGPTGGQLFDYYEKNLRGSLFAGFLTLGSFLLSLKTGIVIKLKEGIYDKDAYRAEVATARHGNRKISYYGPLQRMSRVLALSVLLSLTTATLQLSVGLYQSWIAAAICLATAAAAITFLLCSYALIQLALRDWFARLETESIASEPLAPERVPPDDGPFAPK
jgi:hypothetical protein